MIAKGDLIIKKQLNVLLLFAMLLTMALSLTACVTEKIVYVTESKEDEDDTEIESVESKEESLVNGSADKTAFEVCAVSAQAFSTYYENKGVTVKNPDRSPSIKTNTGTEVELYIEENADEAIQKFCKSVGDSFQSAGGGEDIEFHHMTENFVCISYQKDGVSRVDAILVADNAALWYGGRNVTYNEVIEELKGMGALK